MRTLHALSRFCIVLLLASCASQQTSVPEADLSSGTSYYPDTQLEGQHSRVSREPRDFNRPSRPLNQVMPEINEVVRLNPYKAQPIPGSLGLEGVRAARSANNRALATSIAERTAEEQISNADFAAFAIERLELMHSNKNYEALLSWSETRSFKNRLQFFTDSEQRQVDHLRATAFEAESHYWPAAQLRYQLSARNNRSTRSLSARQPLLRDATSPDYNREMLWRDLLQLDYTELQSRNGGQVSSPLRAWIELASVIRNPALNVKEQSAEYERWQERWSRSPLPRSLQTPRELIMLRNLAEQDVSQIAVLLPLSGQLRHASAAIQDGMIAAQLESPTRYSLRFYDTSGQSIPSLVEQAQRNGADVIVGPLDRKNVRTLVDSPLGIPTLALNYLPDGAPPPINVVQFGLAVEDEAHQISSLIEDASLKKVMLLYSPKDWAVRAANSFERTWTEKKGDTIRVPLGLEKDYNSTIANALTVNQSQLRNRKLQNLMGDNFEFTARRRHDLDAIVVFSNAQQLSAIKPLLSYHYAGGVPVFSSSKLNNYRSASELRDVNGVYFSDVPFVLRKDKFASNVKSQYSNSAQLARLFAMGMDAYFLAPRLGLLQAFEQGAMPGKTGELRLVDQRIERALNNATVKRNSIVTLKKQQIVSALTND